MTKYKFIVNPVPLSKKKKEFIDVFTNRMTHKGLEFSVEYTTKDRNAEIIARESARHGYSIIVPCGGDGTIREVINGIYSTNSALGIMPMGTSNDFAKHLGISSYKKAEEILLTGKRKKINLGEAYIVSDGKRKKILFCSTSGIGFDARLLKLNDSPAFLIIKKLLRKLSYPFFGLFLVFFYKPNDVELIIKDRRIKTRLFMLNANFVKSMSGMRVTANAGVNNDFFDIFMVENANIFKKILGFVWYGFTSKKINLKEVQYISHDDKSKNRFNLSNVDEFTVTSEQPIDVQLNGDIVGYTPAKFTMLRNAIEIIL